MTITPVAASAVPPAAGSTTVAPEGVADQFAALVQQHLDSDNGTQLSGEEKAALLEAAAHSGEAVSEGVASMLAALLGGAVVQAAAQGGTTTPTLATGQTVPADAAAVVPEVTAASVEAAATAGSLKGAALGVMAANAAATAASTLATSAHAPLDAPAAGVPAAVAGLAPDAAPTVGVPLSDAAVGTLPGGTGQVSLEGMQLVAGGAPTEPAAAGSNPTTSPLLGAVSAAGAISGATGAEGAAPEGASRSSMVTDQVFPQVARLVSRGDGMHRLALRLHPADLGEVKVVMTVKAGVVDVTLHAGAAAREALRDGSPQLRSLLELTGATAGQLVVRDLVTTGSPAAQQLGQQLGQQTGQQPGQSDPSGVDLGASADREARDGASGELDGQSGQDGTAARRTGPPGDAVPERPAPRPSTSHLDLDL